MMTLPTDCDQRDERLGWMGDAATSAASIALNYEVEAFYRFFLDTMATESINGSLPDTVPFVRCDYVLTLRTRLC